MREIRVGAAQFEVRDADKSYNLGVIARLAGDAAARGAELVTFNECCISGYTFLETLTRGQMEELAECVPGGPCTERLGEIARRAGVALSAGLVEKDGGRLYNCQIVVDRDGNFIAKHRKLHEFISDHIDCGDRYTPFDLLDCKWGILTCYDNNVPENGRMMGILGVEIVLMPHVTGCLPSPMPGRGTVDAAIWHNRERDPVRCRQEFDGPKGRGWIMRFLPARCWENGFFGVYANPIGVEGGTIKPGGSMILDPFGEVMVECRTLGDEVVVGLLDPKKLELASGRTYVNARRPELYAKFLEPNPHLGPDRRPEVWWKKHRQA
jgi:predicted amidohydrolase